MVKNKFDDESEMKSPVSVSGTAYNAKAGAVLETSDGRVIYIEGLNAWDSDSVEKTIELTGILKKRSSPGTIAGSGTVMQGIPGTTWVLQLTEPYQK